ncbi:hypothetical protein THII_3015 [Thioploca ingrica]|uniref:Uncharacterized protein n=1 Tax=Thioploca ingrica TaxID=40754 RepID=A0A090AMU2_9GAMM|nr:hypothetical protein THII_3015 [Thioploca ingrica]
MDEDEKEKEKTMLLKEQLQQQIDTLSISDLLLLQQVITLLTQDKPPAATLFNPLPVRQALSRCYGNLSDDILQQRQDRICFRYECDS